eukprot:m.57447 g.57447  ORF g.57447 m.57447 type:complete len:51 (-) comp15802_c0_seq3:1516-1668(-)
MFCFWGYNGAHCFGFGGGGVQAEILGRVVLYGTYAFTVPLKLGVWSVCHL